MIEQPTFAQYIGNVAAGMDGLSGPLHAASAKPETSIPSRSEAWVARTQAQSPTARGR